MPNKQNVQEAAATATAETNDAREVWAIMRAAHEQAFETIHKDGYTLFECEPKPDKNAPMFEKIDYMTFAFFCEGFIKGLSITPSKGE